MKKINYFTLFFIMFFFLFQISILPANAFRDSQAFYITPNGSGNGSSWTQATSNLENVISNSIVGDVIYVSGGEYTLSSTLDLQQGVTMYGSMTEGSDNIENRNFETNPSVLSGDNTIETVVSMTDFSGETATVLDGFTITGGKHSSVTSTTDSNSAGIFISNNAAPITIKNCLVINNQIGSNAYYYIPQASGILVHGSSGPVIISKSSILDNKILRGICVVSSTIDIEDCEIKGHSTSNSHPGAGMAICGNSNVTIRDSVFSNNGSTYGGALTLCYSASGTNLKVDSCIFRGNSGTEGGAFCVNGPSNTKTSFSKCTFADNSVSFFDMISDAGSAIFANGASVDSNLIEVQNCTIANNTGSSAIDARFGARLKISNCTISDNQGGIILYNYPSGPGSADVSMKNSIISGNGSDLWIAEDAGIIRSYGFNIIENSNDVTITTMENEGTNIFGVDPLLEAIDDNAGFNLTMALLPDSPAIDAGSSTDIDGTVVSFDQRGVSRPQGDYNDIGAYERELVSYSITTTVTAGGNIDPVSADVPEGADQTFTVTPYDGYILSDLLDGEESVSADMDGNDFTFTNVVEGHTLNAAFIIDPIMKEEAGVGDFQVENEGIGSITSDNLVNEEDIKSLNMGGISSGDVEGLIGDEGADTNNFVSGFSFDVNYSDDEGNDIFALDVTLDISREDLGQDICDAVDAGDDLAVAFFENISIYKIVSPDAFDLFEVASEDHEQPLNFFEVTSDDSSYHVSMSMVIEDNETPGSADTLEAVKAGMDSYFYVYDGVADGKFTDPLVAVSKTSETPPVEDGDNTAINGGDGCNFGLFSPMVTMILLPLLFFLRK